MQLKGDKFYFQVLKDSADQHADLTSEISFQQLKYEHDCMYVEVFNMHLPQALSFLYKLFILTTNF